MFIQIQVGMKIIASTLVPSLLLFVACKEQPQSYTLPLEDCKTLIGEVWQEGDANALSTDLYVTDEYYIFLENNNPLMLKAYKKDNSVHYIGFNIDQDENRKTYSIDIVKSNTRYESEKNDIWIVENSKNLKNLRVQNNSFTLTQTISLHRDVIPSASYHFTKEEIYGVPLNGHAANAFYFFQPDSGYYWVKMYGATKNMQSHYKKNPYAFLSNLCVNEKENTIICGFLFINQIQFFDLRGNIIRSVKVGNINAAPVNDIEGSLDYKSSTKYILDVCSSDKYVYCIFNGSADFDSNSRILIFKWDGTHVMSYQADRKLKKIAFDKKNKQLVALTSNKKGGRDVVLYPIK